MNRILSIILLLVVMAVPAYAQYDRDIQGREAGFVRAASTGGDKVLISRPVMVYAVTVDATSASASVDLHDSASTPTTGAAIKVEVGQATQHNSNRVVFDPPLYFENGVYADVTSGGVVVEYR